MTVPVLFPNKKGNFKTFQVYSSFYGGIKNEKQKIISKLFKFIVHFISSHLGNIISNISKLFKFIVHIIIGNVPKSVATISKLFKFIVHLILF